MATEQPAAEDLLLDLPELVAPYVQGAAILAADWYNNQDADSSYYADPDHGIADERLAATVGWIYAGPQRPESRIRVAAHTMVFDAARNTVWRNAEAEGVNVARQEMAESCQDCLARASVNPREKTGRSDDVARDFHPSCEGLFVPIRTGVYTPPDYLSAQSASIV
jgi:hypothetical protein